MTIYFVGTEDLDFFNVGNGQVNTAYNSYRSAYTRCSLQVLPSTNYYANTNLTYWSAPTAFSESTFWFTARCCDSTGVNGSTNPGGRTYFLQFVDGSGKPRLQLSGPSTGYNQSTQYFILQTVDSSGLISNIATTNGGFNQNYPAKIDMYVNYANAGAVIVYIDTVPVLTYSGNITTNSVTTLTGVNLGQVLNTGGGGAFAGSGTSWSEIIVASSDTRGLSLQTLVPSGNGASSQWTGNYSNINELTINDSAGIGSNTANQLSLFSQSGSYTAPFISAIAISARSITANGAPQHLTLAVHEGNTTSTAGTFAPSTYYGLNQYIWQTDPITGTYWSNTTNVQIGAQSLT